jgi:hypothetical protein
VDLRNDLQVSVRQIPNFFGLDLEYIDLFIPDGGDGENRDQIWNIARKFQETFQKKRVQYFKYHLSVNRGSGDQVLHTSIHQ